MSAELAPLAIGVGEVSDAAAIAEAYAMPAPAFAETTSIRVEALSLWTVVGLARTVSDVHKHADNLRMLMAYAVEHHSRSRRTPMDVPAMVAAWVPIIRGLGAAHSKEGLDRCEFEMERHMTPLLAAPVKQLREFYAGLVDALKADPLVPFFVWSMFDAYHEVIVKKASDAEALELKKDLAQEIADLVEADVRPDIGKAIAAALQWRHPEQLEQVRKAVKGGAKPRLVGKESCLFLQVGEATVML